MLILASCGGQRVVVRGSEGEVIPASKEITPTGYELPRDKWWVNSIRKAGLPDDGVYAVGSSEKSVSGTVTRERADAAARNAMAATLTAELQSLTTNYQSSVATLMKEGTKEKVESLFNQAVKQVVDQVLIGCEMFDRFNDPNDKGLAYTLAKISKENVATQIFDTIKKDVIDNEEVIEIKENADKAFEELKNSVKEWRER